MSSLCTTTLLGSSVYVLLSPPRVPFLGVVIEGRSSWPANVVESRSGPLHLPPARVRGRGLRLALLLRPVVAQPVAVFVLGAVVATVVDHLANLLTDRCSAPSRGTPATSR